MVKVKCDYCGVIKNIEYQQYSKCMKSGSKYACQKCQNIKNANVFEEKYGVKNVFALPEIQNKIIETNQKRYKVNYHTQLEEYKIKYLYGEKNHFYIDGRDKNTLDRHTAEYKKWRESVFKRDKYVCQICSSNIKIVCHHLNSYIAFEDDRFKIENGITLCEECHMDFHWIYGYGNNTYEQFKEWLAKTSNDYPVRE